MSLVYSRLFAVFLLSISLSCGTPTTSSDDAEPVRGVEGTDPALQQLLEAIDFLLFQEGVVLTYDEDFFRFQDDELGLRFLLYSRSHHQGNRWKVQVESLETPPRMLLDVIGYGIDVNTFRYGNWVISVLRKARVLKARQEVAQQRKEEHEKREREETASHLELLRGAIQQEAEQP